jgi:hypothetical protein
LIGVGFFLLHTATIRANPVPIADIDTWLNYASVWIEGTVISGPEISERSISFEVQDASGGQIEVDVYHDPRELKLQGKIPGVGDEVKVFGMLRVYRERPMEIRVSALGVDRFTGEEKFQVKPVQPAEKTLMELLWDWELWKYKPVTVEGTITGITPYYTAKVYTLENGGITLGLYIHNGLVYADNKTLDLNLLQRVRVTAGISKWGNLSLRSYDDIEVIENGTPVSVDIENIHENLDGKIVEVDGKIIFVELEGKDTSRRLTLSGRQLWLDSSDNPPIWLSESVYKLLSESTQKSLRRGSTVTELQGKVKWAEFEVKFYGIPEPKLVRGEYEPPFVENTLEITRENKNDFVTVQGRVVNVEDDYAGPGVPDHKKLTLEDGFGGTIEIWIPNILYERMLDPPSVEDTVRVVGKVVERDGEIQLRPGVPNDVEVREV